MSTDKKKTEQKKTIYNALHVDRQTLYHSTRSSSAAMIFGEILDLPPGSVFIRVLQGSPPGYARLEIPGVS